MIEQLRRLAFVATGAIAGCALQPSPDGSVAGGCAPGGCPACPVCPAQPAALPRANPLEQVDFSALTGWKDGEHAAAWNALLASCQALRWREAWRGVCARAMGLRAPSDDEARRFLESARRDGHYLYAQTGRTGAIVALRVGRDGSLTTVGEVTVPGAAGGEGIVAS